MTFSTQNVDIAAHTDRGRQRSDNQDAVGRADEAPYIRREQRETYGRLYLVADGVGGNADGAVASRLVVERTLDHFYNDHDLPEDPELRLVAAIKRASVAVHNEAVRRRNNMRSTVVAALIHDDRLIIANVGDSPAFLIRPNQAPKQLSVAHVHKSDRGKGSLAQAMGDEEVYPARFAMTLQPDDIVVLCSDGLTDLVKPDEIADITQRYPAEQATRQLINLANKRGGHDNISVIVIRNGQPPAVSSLPAAPSFDQRWLIVAGGVLGVVVLLALVLFALPRNDAVNTDPPSVRPTLEGGSRTEIPNNSSGAPGLGNLPTATLAGFPTSTFTPTPEPTRLVPTRPASRPTDRKSVV